MYLKIAALCNNVKVSPRRLDPNNRAVLIDIAARLISEAGPGALSTRRLAAEAGTSTMAVYTYFGGLPALVRAVVAEGFARLAEHLGSVVRTADPLSDLAALATAYRANAHANPHLYAVMFGTASLGGYRRDVEETDEARGTFEVLVDGVRRAADAGAVRADDAEQLAAQL